MINMVRPIRIQFPGATYHVFSKGNRNDRIFQDDQDKNTFLGWLKEGSIRYKVDVYAYCVMESHYHLLILTQEGNLSEFMHFLLSSYASYLSKKGWEGHIFAGRYNALLVDKEEYLLVLSRYIHLNPVAAGMVKMPEHYRWSSYSSLIDLEGTPGWLSTEWMIEHFGPGYRSSRQRYRKFVEADMEKPLTYPEDKIVARSILGGIGFVEEVISKIDKELDIDIARLKIALVGPVTLEGIYQAVCGYHGLDNLKITEADDGDNCRNARKAFVYMARKYTTSCNREISEIMGDITSNGVSLNFKRTEKLLEIDEQYQEAFYERIGRILCSMNMISSPDTLSPVS